MPGASAYGFVGLIAGVATLRLAELRLSARNLRRLRARGGVESGQGHYPGMVALHTGFLVAAPLEVVVLCREFHPALGLTMLGLFALAVALRVWVIRTLGDRWCTRVVVLPGVPLVTGGPFRLLRHPNYLAVAVEMPALALVHTAWLSALVFGGLNLLLLRTRIQVEDAALGSTAASSS